MESKERLIVALDVDTKETCLKLIETLSPVVDIFKVGIAPFVEFGEEILQELRHRRKKVFLDLKFHDIPNTVKNAAIAAVKKEVFMINFHCLGGEKMLQEAVFGVKDFCAKKGIKAPILLGVTVLTSMAQEDLAALGIKSDVKTKVREFAVTAKRSGLDGVVASSQEILDIKEVCGKKFLVVTPGIRPKGAIAGDQKRVETPLSAIKDGADFLVVGRPIIGAQDPVLAAKNILEEMSE
ncbi:orotidine 5'-phosphate decarboxylase [Candidatus Omnitrophus magneticus]|uniref:Orotidine 5'-phosphate decarboxylase n=1 Tax=Candidatus Omnitrophus magneticus TaxID=1609969 RepID=A0A0F0CST2_9BACT|nr:orotidine 5'-phosphate decarboxylase [Candidatus Omnitrophus magneticus]